MRLRIVLVFVLMLAVSLPAVGCSRTSDEVEIRNQAREAWEKETGEDIKGSTPDRYTDNMSESHSMMIKMILSGQGKNTDLDSYTDLYLVKMKTASGEERMVVVAEGSTIFPANMPGEGQ